MTGAVVAVGRRYLPRGWSHLGLQLVIWFGFLGAYQVARGMAPHDSARALANGLRVIGWEQSHAHHLFELTFQNLAASSHLLELAVSWTYWLSEFPILGLALLWAYLRRHEAFARFRNTILLTNVIGLVGYVLMPTAPPRMFPDFGFADTLGSVGGLNHGSGLIQLASNPYAAMPSLHAADALIVGITLAYVCRNRLAKLAWALWPAWVWFSVMATANHFWLDIVAGVGVAGGLARSRVTPNALTASGVLLCAAASVLVYFEYRNEILFYWVGAVVFVVGSVLDILDGALARLSGKGTPFGAFLDSTTDRVSEGFMLGSIALVFHRHGNQVALAFTFAAVAGSFLVSYTRARAEALGLKGDVGIGSRAERVVVITAGLVLAPWGALQWAIYLLAATAWFTVGQRVWSVRAQLRTRS